MKLKLKCDYCGKEIYKDSTRITKHNFCSRKCLADFSSKSKNKEHYLELKDYTNMANVFKRVNKETNKKRMTFAVREKLRNSKLGTGLGKTYTKFYGRHEHRIVAEEMLGRKLKKGEVIHHIDGNKRNNSPENLMIFKSLSEHSKYHMQLRKNNKMKGGDENEI